MNVATAAAVTTTTPAPIPLPTYSPGAQPAPFDQAFGALKDVQQDVAGFLARMDSGSSYWAVSAEELTSAANQAMTAAQLLTGHDWPQAQGARSGAIESAQLLDLASHQARGEYAGNVDANVRASVSQANDKLSMYVHLLSH